MAGFVKWSRSGDDDWHADVKKCVRINNRINITFENREDGFEGQVSFDAKSGKQETSGRWISNPKASEDFSAPVQGKLSKFAVQLVFEGTWDENDGELWDFYIEAVVA